MKKDSKRNQAGRKGGKASSKKSGGFVQNITGAIKKGAQNVKEVVDMEDK